MSDKTKQDSPLVKSVLALDHHLAELERIGAKINSADMTSDVDFEFIQKLMARFAECGQGISEEVSNLSTHLQQAQRRAEAVSQGVSKQAELFKIRQNFVHSRYAHAEAFAGSFGNLLGVAHRRLVG